MLNQTIERTTLSNLIYNEDYCRTVLPFIKPTYFEVKEERIIFEEIYSFVDKYKKIPSQISLEIEVEQRKEQQREEEQVSQPEEEQTNQPEEEQTNQPEEAKT